MRVRLETLGCRLNEAELERWARQFAHRGARITGEGEPADLVVVNTCAVTQEAVRKSRKLLRRVQRDNARAKLLVSGCYATLESAELARAAGVDRIVSNTDKDRLVDIALDELTTGSMPLTAMEPAEPAPLFARGRRRAFVKVQDGCRHRCTFCVVTLARGPERSRTPEEIIAEIATLVAEGVNEVVLTGVHLGGYGSDIGSNLTRLIAAILDRTAVSRLRLGSLEPWDLPPALYALFAEPRLMPHLHLPAQSGSDRVLRRMARRSDRAGLHRLIDEARAAVPDINLTTDIIVGFPGESEADWAQTLDFVESIRFGHVHIFVYSPRAGTKAAEMTDPIRGDIKHRRSRELHRLAADSKRRVLEDHVGRNLPVLIEGSYRQVAGESFGYSPNYLGVRIRGAEDVSANQIVDARLVGVDSAGEHLLGELSPA